MKYGIIDRSYFTFRYPRDVDYGPFDSVLEAFGEVAGLVIGEGLETLEIRPCKYVKSRDIYVEDSESTDTIEIDASRWTFE